MSRLPDVAARIATAVDEQLALVTAHCARVVERRDRYDRHSVAHAVANVEVLTWEEIRCILVALADGRTVSPS